MTTSLASESTRMVKNGIPTAVQSMLFQRRAGARSWVIAEAFIMPSASKPPDSIMCFPPYILKLGHI